MSAHTDEHPATGRVGEGRVVVLGYDYNDARLALGRHRELKGAQDPTVVSATAHPGSWVGMRAHRVYVTPSAHRGERYEGARRAFTAAGAELVHLQGEGGSYGVL